MDDDQLFLARLDDLERLTALGDEYSMLCASGMLRQLFLDASPLVHRVNRRCRLQLRFPVCGRQYREIVLADSPGFFSALHGIHTSGPFSHQREDVTIDQFLATLVLKLGDKLLTVRDLISISANVLGGVHKGDPGDAKEIALSEFKRLVSIGPTTLDAAQLKPIILIALDGLAALRTAASGTPR